MHGHTVFRALAIASFLACYITIIVGGNVIASGSGLGCPNWPMCGSSVVPTLSGPAEIEFSHRAVAFVLSVLVLGLAITGLIAERSRPTVVRLTFSALAVVVLEAILGGVVVDSHLVVWIVLVHFAVATVLFALLLLIAVLANLRELPAGFKAWARRAMEERSPPARRAPPEPDPPRPAPAPGTTPAGPLLPR
jgi:heme A synthase